MGRRKQKNNRKLFILIIGLAIVLAVLIVMMVTAKEKEVAETSADTLKGVKVVIDAGHGGFDGGTVGGSTGVLEAEINLSISVKLERRLQQLGAQVVMTRSDENAVAETKDGDMAKRREIIESSDQDVTISIHQNRFEDPDVKGPQVFYNPGSVQGEKLAAAIQDTMNQELEVASPRTQQGKAYYIVKSGAAPAVIVECGFLSNPEEEKLLMNDEYQNLIVKAIIDGLENYLDQTETDGGLNDAV